MIINFIRNNYILLSIFLFGLVLRIVNINLVPPTLNWDEASHGYNAYSLLTTGHDEWGQKFPIIFRAFGDYKLPVYIYLTVVSEAFFGLSQLAVRMPSIIFGSLGILLTYFITHELLKEKRPAIFAAMFVAIEPWTFFLSRGAFESNVSWVLTLTGVILFLKALKNPKLLMLSALTLGLSVWTYNSARIFVPLFVLFLLLLYKRELMQKLHKEKFIFLTSGLLLALFFIPMFYQLSKTEGSARYNNVAILDSGAINTINNLRGASSISPKLSQFIYNKATYLSVNLANNWFSHFSPNFLFFSGGSQYQFSIPDKGLLYFPDILFLMAGLVFVFQNRTSKWAILIFGWILLAPVASSLTREAPHVLRSSTLLPIPMIISALGFWKLSNLLKEKAGKHFSFVLIVILLVMIFLSCANYLKSYINNYPTDYSWAWQYGYKEVVGYARNHYNEYDNIIFTKKYGEPHEFLLFYWPWDPTKYNSDPNLIRFHQSDWYWVDRFDKFYFVNDWQIPKNSNSEFKMESGGTVPITNKTLLITSPGNYPNDWKLLETVNFLDNKPAFDIVTKK